jgi:DNA repair ATPase RecN
MDRLYEKDKARIVDKLNKFEKQNVFKSEVERLESGLEDLKKYHNDIKYKIKNLDKTDACHENYITGFDQKYKLTRELRDIEYTEEQVRENQNLLLGGQYTQEKLIHKMEQYQSDIMALKKNIQQLQSRVRQCSILNHDINYEIDRARQMQDKMQLNFTGGFARKTQKFGPSDGSTAMDTICAQNMEDEMSLFEDRIILNEIKNHEDRLQKEKASQFTRQRVLAEEERKTKLEELNRERRKENKRLTKEIEKRFKELSEVMAKMKVTHPEGVLSRVGEMTAIKEG